MKTLKQTVAVPYRYQVHFTEDLFSSANSLLEAVIAARGTGPDPRNVLCVLDGGLLAATPGLVFKIETYFHNRPALRLVAPPIVVTGREQVKDTAEFLHFVEAAILRHDICVIAIGGAAVLQMASYASASRIIRVPTTVRSQIDSAVAITNGIDGRGVVAPPYAVLNDSAFLRTLSDAHWRAGIVEALRLALVRDEAFFASIESAAPALGARRMEPMRQLIYRCVELHIAQPGNSEFALRDGEAVATGIALDSTYSWLAGLLPHRQLQRILRLLLALGFTLDVPASVTLGRSGIVTPLLADIGSVVEAHVIQEDLLAASIRTVRQTAAFATSLRIQEKTPAYRRRAEATQSCPPACPTSR